jgi:outer membrane protein assembly factor BamB
VSPKIVTIDGEDHLVMITACSRDGSANGLVAGVDPKTGKRLWTYPNWQCRIPIPNVTEIGQNRLFITGGYEAGSVMIRITKTGNSYTVTELHKTDDFGTHCHPPVLHEGHLYAHCTTNTRRDGMVCMDLDGKVKWKTGRSPVFDKGGFLLADGLIFSVDGRKGVLYLIEPHPSGFKSLASAQLLGENECWAPLALVDGKLLIRDQEQMKCVVVR